MYKWICFKYCDNIVFSTFHLLILIHCFKMILTSKQQTEIRFNKRERRTPDSESIKRWKLAFSGDLAIPLTSTKKVHKTLTCNWALNELCLTHVSCRELWLLFRRNCLVDAQNNCRMSNKNDCWQSFEGISWTGLGACNCPGNNSDCHWIRLQTNYNKCIYELSNDPSWHGKLNSPAQFDNQRRFGPTVSTITQLTIVKMPEMNPKNEFETKKDEDESEEKRRRIIANEARLARIHAQEQKKLQIKTEQEMEHRKREKLQKGRERGNWVNQNLHTTQTTELNTTVFIGNDAFQNIILKDEKPKRVLQNKLDEDKKFKQHLNKFEKYQNKFDEKNNLQNIIEHQNNNQNIDEKQNKFEKQNNQQNMIEKQSNPQNKFAHQKNENMFEIQQNKSEQNMTEKQKHNFVKQNKSEKQIKQQRLFEEEQKKFKTLRTVTNSTTLTRNNKNTEKFNKNGTNGQNSSEITTSPNPNSLQIFPTQSNEKLVTQAETPPTKINNLLIDQNKEENNVILKKNDSNSSSIISTCPQIIQICEKDETTACNWHLSELRIKCQQTVDKNNICLQKKREPQCSAAISRFVRFVADPLVEAMIFCSPSTPSEGNEILPLHLNPTNCLLNSNEHKQQKISQWSCRQTAKMCKAEPACSHRLNYLLSACPISNASSPYVSSTCLLPDNPSSLRKCRLALAKSRGTWLDEPCHCLPNGGGDFKECKKWEMTLWPRNPCIEKVAADFNQLFIGGYLKFDHRRRNKTNNFLIKKNKLEDKELGSIEKGIFVLEEDKEEKSLDKENIFKEKINKKSSESSLEISDKFENDNIIEGIYNLTEKNEEENKNNNKQLLSYYLDKKQENKNIDKVEFIKKRKRPIGRKIASKNNILLNTELIDVNEFQTPIVANEGRGCRTRNIDGEWIEHYTETIFRQFTDWSGRCSSWCSCIVKGKEGVTSENVSSHTISCHSLGCLQDRLCETKHTTVVFGQRLYLENRGACLCHNGQFICDSSELQPELEPGIYLSLGYSQAEIDIIREKVPKLILERSGLISHSNSIIKDLATRLQFALEKILPSGLRCRIVVVEHFKSEQGVLMQIQWFGIDHSANQTQAKWQSGKMEKHCSPYVRELELTFWLEKSERYQLLLSTIKQVKAIDLLDALPLISSANGKIELKNKLMQFLLISLSLILYRRFGGILFD